MGSNSGIFQNPNSKNIIRKSAETLDFKAQTFPINVAEVINVIYTGRDAGCIFYRHSKNTNVPTDNILNKALPLFSNIKMYPVKGELVALFNLGNTYYIHLNFLNNPVSNQSPTVFNDTLKQQSVDSSKVHRSNKTFNPSKQYYVTRLFEGDIVYEGRFGQSIKFGSTNKENNIPLNNYSKSNLSDNGDPIMIIRNGIKSTQEDIQKDGSSIYMCSTQKINIDSGDNGFSGMTSTWSTININAVPVETVAPEENNTNSINSARNSEPATPDPERNSNTNTNTNTNLFNSSSYTQLTTTGMTTIASGSTGFLDPGNLTISQDGLKHLIREEGSREYVYDDHTGKRIARYEDAIGYPTIGVGHLIKTSERERFAPNLKGGIPLTDEQIQELLLNDLGSRINYLNNNITAKVTQNMFDALVSMLFNTGAGNAFFRAAINHTNQQNYTQAADTIKTGPVTSKGQVVPALVARRENESNIYSA